MKVIDKIRGAIAKASLAAAAFIMGTVGLAIFANVFCRFILKIGLMWVDQYARYALIWSVFLAANVLIYRNGLMKVDFFDSHWPKRMKTIREAVYSVIFIIMLGVLGYEGMSQAIAYIGVQLMGLHIDKFWVYLSIPVGSFLMLVQYLLILLRIALERKEGGVTEA